jgi:hypothetical protein
MQHNSVIALERASQTVGAVRHLLVVLSGKKLRKYRRIETACTALAMQLKTAEQEMNQVLESVNR